MAWCRGRGLGPLGGPVRPSHGKFIGYASEAVPLLQATGLDKLIDDGFIQFGNGSAGAASFLAECRQLRYWPRQGAESNPH